MSEPNVHAEHLIVNADDFGASPGVNRGIVAAHRHGIVTSASLMVDTPWSRDAAELSRDCPDLGIGLHVVAQPDATVDAQEIKRQLDAFHILLGGPPTHLDSHHHVHREPALQAPFMQAAESLGIPLRGHSRVHTHFAFYGQWGGKTHLEQIGVDSLLRILDEAAAHEFSELVCHPAEPDAELASSYSVERATELATLCDPAIRRFVARRGLKLVHFGAVRVEALAT